MFVYIKHGPINHIGFYAIQIQIELLNLAHAKLSSKFELIKMIKI
jgi:hypothetical protein